MSNEQCLLGSREDTWPYLPSFAKLCQSPALGPGTLGLCLPGRIALQLLITCLAHTHNMENNHLLTGVGSSGPRLELSPGIACTLTSRLCAITLTFVECNSAKRNISLTVP